MIQKISFEKKIHTHTSKQNYKKNSRMEEENFVIEKFDSLQQTYGRDLEFVLNHEVADKEWGVYEKIHGCNYSFQSNGIKVIPASRNQLLSNGAHKEFFHSDKIFDPLVDNIIALFKELTVEYPNLKRLNVFGELFGGKYPGQSHSSKCKVIQGEVLYSPNICFKAFSICLDGKDMNRDKAIELFIKHDIPYVKKLFHANNLKEALEWSALHKEDISGIPLEYGLPPLPENFREGHVLDPIEPCYTKFGQRICLKDKGKRFMEHKPKNTNKNANNNTASTLNFISKEEIDDIVERYLTLPRYANVTSKEVDNPKISKEIKKKILINKFALDAVADWCNDEKKNLIKTQMKQVASIIYKNAESSINKEEKEEENEKKVEEEDEEKSTNEETIDFHLLGLD
jgi:Rnl2 family RNA ligase